MYKQIATKAKDNETTPTPRPPTVLTESGYTSQGIPLPLLLAEDRRNMEEKQQKKDRITKMLVEGKRSGGGTLREVKFMRFVRQIGFFQALIK